MTGPIDLDQERRTRRNLAELRHLVTSGATDPDRARVYLTALPLEALVSDSQPVKLPPDLLTRADDLVPLLALRPELAGYARVTRAAVVRIALGRGLDALTAELETPAPTPATKPGKGGARG